MENCLFSWAAIDISSWEVLGMWVTKGCASFEAYSFLKFVLRKCENTHEDTC
ncbi:MAG: hypothetical protein QHH15_03420 [Candidatus Thermoplasmatota archaeon]|nr:hypothetical protein [Candidatus Thermoplasmatota archaeon]